MTKLLFTRKLWPTVGLLSLSCALLFGDSASAASIQTLHTNATSFSTLVAASDGYLYGTTPYGGANDLGSVFRISTAGAYQVLYSFSGSTDGANPQAALVSGPGGNLYGTTPYGAVNHAGSIFKITTNGTFTLLRSLVAATDGSEPMAGLVFGTNGLLYGTASQSGTYGFGTVFQITTNGTFTTLHHFAGSDGATPVAALTSGTDGLLYSTTQYGGTNNRGTVFKMTTTGTFTSLVSFTGANGGNPQAPLVQWTDGSFYGTTAYGGSGEFGTVFKITSAGVLSTLFSPALEVLGSNPSAGLTMGLDGKLNGTALFGGSNGFGSLFQVTSGGAGGAFTQVYGFTGNADGANPATALVLGLDGNLYGDTSLAGDAGAGAFFGIVGPLAISLQPVARTNYIGTTATFAVTAGGPGPYTYQWQKNGVNLTDGGNVIGATSNLLTLNLVVQSDATNYSVVVSNTTSGVTSSNALLTVVVITPVFSSVVPFSNRLFVAYSGTIGDPNGRYTVLTSTNLPGPATNWVPLLTNFFSGTGSFAFTNAVKKTENTRFYRLHLP